ncbi:group II intron maturase-specific domain-containing protein [Paenibacillus sp. J2TS4]|uniref:group II intron maturase-specific domain-containing protein n=1 Tax=Paenibacillus sp. J2TS4 TaxID=2807194 RepID=UPI001BCF0FE7|nr:group II intron maturase-specific domain-containing protein [Paenibacillus sp. J2TS4]
MESEGSWRQNSGPRNTNIIRDMAWDELAIQSEVQYRRFGGTARSNGMGIEERAGKLRRYIMGWINYFKLADMKKLLQTTDEWMRRRIRMVYWKQWKR